MTYVIVKYLHVITAAATIAGFLLRGYWMLTESEILRHRATRMAPHVVDTVFLLSGVGMIWMLRLNPFTQMWLLAKFAGLIAYILLGTIAIKRGPTRQVRAIAFVGAISVLSVVQSLPP